MSLKNKRILITAGPTWVPIDSVRVISNIATGVTGALLAKKLQKLGAKVTLLLGPVSVVPLNKKIRVINFKFFGELREAVIAELSSKKYDIAIHSAAVSDYKPKRKFGKKINSWLKHWQLKLEPTPKIIDLMKKIDRGLFVVGFKFETEAPRETLISKTRSLINRAKLDLAVANTINKKGYVAYIVGRNKIVGPIKNKEYLACSLINILAPGAEPIPACR